MNSLTKTTIAVGVFSAAMAAIESAVVVYLRALYYPGEFTVAFRLIDEKVVVIEILREVATIIMLASVGFLAGKNFRERLAWFLLAFAVWDLCYYGWLKVFIDWPASILDWDILFLIPFTWLGPVLAPVICSVTMIAFAIVLLSREPQLPRLAWTLIVVGCAFILYTFMKDYGWLIVGHGFLDNYAGILGNKDFIELASGYLPRAFEWRIFFVGEFCLVGGILLQASGFRPLKRYVRSESAV
jgi:hypothetical protein